MNILPKVLHVALGEPFRVQQFVTELGEALCRMAGSGRAAAISDANLAFLRRAARLGARAIQVQRSRHPRRDRQAMANAIEPLHDFKAELIHAYGMSSALLADHISKQLRVPWVLSAFTAVSPGWREKRVLLRAASIAAISERALPARLNLAADIIPGGIDKREFTPPAVAENLMAELGLNPYTLHIGFVGQLDRLSSGAGDFITAAIAAATKIPFIEFLVVGDGKLLDELEAKAHQAGIYGNVRFLGPRHDRGRLYHVMDCVVLPAHESVFPWELMEAAAANTPVLASDIRPHRDLVQDADPLVTYFPPGDVNALASKMLNVVEMAGRNLGMDVVDLGLLGTGFHGVVRARISSTHYAIGEDELEEIEDPDSPQSLRRKVYREYEIGRIAKRYAEFYRKAMTQRP